MSKVNIPFQNQFKTPMLSETKTCTSRTKQFGKVGDTFLAFGNSFVITKVEKLSLMVVSNDLFKTEGFETPGDFQSCWGSIHPMKGYVPYQIVWVHFFAKE